MEINHSRITSYEIADYMIRTKSLLSAKELAAILEKEYFTVKEVVLDDEDGYQIRLTPQLTGKGQQWLTRKLLDAGLLKPVAAE
ncbi:phage antirepressor KilAC domain-containing protein [Escherichia fergusonii]